MLACLSSCVLLEISDVVYIYIYCRVTQSQTNMLEVFESKLLVWYDLGIYYWFSISCLVVVMVSFYLHVR